MPVLVDSDHHSLSAILLQEDYYNLIRTHQDNRKGFRVANATALIPLKAYAWLDLNRRKEEGEKIDSKNISKHRSDVFRLAATLPGEPGPELPAPVLNDLRRFLEAFPLESGQWPANHSSHAAPPIRTKQSSKPRNAARKVSNPWTMAQPPEGFRIVAARAHRASRSG